jgi:hypothetical protein
LSVTALIGIESRAQGYILRLARGSVLDLVLSEWAARAVLRYRRLRHRLLGAVEGAAREAVRASMQLAAHVLILGIGVVLVVPVLTAHAAPARIVAYSGYVPWTSTVHMRNAPEMTEIFKASSVEERPAPTAPDPSTMTSSAGAASGFAPPPGAGGAGLAAIYAVFGNSPGLTWALRVAYCESRYNPLAINRSSGASGLFQFMPSTWNANFPGQNIWDPMAQARGALVFYNAGRQSAWVCK